MLNNNSLKRKDTANQSGAKTAGVKGRVKKEPVDSGDNYYASLLSISSN